MARRDFGLHKVGPVWHCDFWVEKIHIHKSTKTDDWNLALETAGKWHSEALRKARGLPVDSEVTCEGLFNKWLAWAKVHRSESHRLRVQADWDLHILPAIGKRQAKTIRDTDAEDLRTAFLASPSRRNEHYDCAQHKPRTIEGANKVMRHLRLVFRWGVYPAELLASVPFRVIVEESPEKPKAFLEQSQLRPFLAAVDTGQTKGLER